MVKMSLFQNPLYREDIETILDLSIDFTKLKNSKILITGGTGLIGTVLIDMLEFVNSIYNLNITIDLITRNKESCINKFLHIKTLKINYFEHNIQNKFETNTVYTHIIHGASNTHPLLYSQDPVGSLTTNLFGTYNLLEIAKNCPNCRFLLLSSVEIYGEDIINKKNGFSEIDFGYLDCNTLRANYCEGKRASESLMQAYKSQYNVDVVISRLCRCYGPTLKKDDTKALSQFINNGINKQNIVLKSDGSQFYSYLYVSDIATAILFCLLHGLNGQAYNISDELSNISLKDLAELIADITNTKVIYNIPEDKEKQGYSKATRAILNSEKIKKLGWKAKYNIKEGIKRTIVMLNS